MPDDDDADAPRPLYRDPDAPAPLPIDTPRKRPRRFGDRETLQRALEADEDAPWRVAD